MTTPLKDLTFSEQKGPPGHCFVAQVWGPDGRGRGGGRDGVWRVESGVPDTNGGRE